MNSETNSITLRLHGVLQQIVGQRLVEVPVAEATLGDMLNYLVEKYGTRVAEMLFDRQGDLWRSLILLVNDNPVQDGQQTSVKAGDTISILFPVAGG